MMVAIHIVKLVAKSIPSLFNVFLTRPRRSKLPRKVFHSAQNFFLFCSISICSFFMFNVSNQCGNLLSPFLGNSISSSTISGKFQQISEEHQRIFKDCKTEHNNIVNVSKMSSVPFLTRTQKYYMSKGNVGIPTLTLNEPVSTGHSEYFPFSLEVLWSDNQKKFKVCRFRNACIMKDGALLLHHTLKEHEHLFQDCFFNHLRFFQNEQNFSENSLFSNVSLYSAGEFRKHIPLFLTDVIPSLYANELLTSKYNHSGEAVYYKCTMANNHSCPPNYSRNFDTDRNVAIHVEDAALNLKSNHWVYQFSSMLFENVYFTSSKNMLEGSKLEKKCFNNIVSFTPFRLGKSPNNSSLWENALNRFFVSNGLRRSTNRCHSKGARITNYSTENNYCKVHVVIINRHSSNERNEDLPSGRYLVDIDEIESRILSDSQKSKDPRIDMKLSIVYFEDMTFAEQIHIVQMADIIVGVHGAGLANLIFARKGTPILEVFPFFYFPVRFEKLTQGFNLKYSHIFAYPDPQTYFRCINYRSRNGRKEDMFVIAVDTWREALRRRANDTYNLMNSSDIGHFAVRSCARSQQLKIDMSEFSKKVMDITREFCRTTSMQGK